MDHGSVVNKIFESKIGGGPRSRRLEDIEKDVQQMKVKNWRQGNGQRRMRFFNDGGQGCTRAVRKVSIHFEYLESRSCGLDVSWQPVR